MIETKVRKVRNSGVMTLTTEMLTILDAKEGDTLFVMRGDDGSLKITPHDPPVECSLREMPIKSKPILMAVYRVRHGQICRRSRNRQMQNQWFAEGRWHMIGCRESCEHGGSGTCRVARCDVHACPPAPPKGRR